MKVYLAGHMPKDGEVDWRSQIAGRLSNYDIEFLIPQDTKNTFLKPIKHDATAAKDEMYMNMCDIAIVNLDLDMGKCLGAMWEFGYLYQRHVPVILWNHHTGMPRTYFLEHKAAVVVDSFEELIQLLIYYSEQ